MDIEEESESLVVTTLLEMGFEYDDARAAWDSGLRTIESAINWISNGKPSGPLQLGSEIRGSEVRGPAGPSGPPKLSLTRQPPALTLGKTHAQTQRLGVSSLSSSGPSESDVVLAPDSNPFSALSESGPVAPACLPNPGTNGPAQDDSGRIVTTRYKGGADVERFKQKEIDERKREALQDKQQTALAKRRVMDQIEEDKERRRREKLGHSTQVSRAPTSDPSPAPAQSVAAGRSAATAGSAQTVQIRVRLPAGKAVMKSFDPATPMSHVKRWLIVDWLVPESSTLLQPHPRKQFSEADMEKTLAELGLVRSVALTLQKGTAGPSTDHPAASPPAPGLPNLDRAVPADVFAGRAGPVLAHDPRMPFPMNLPGRPGRRTHQWGSGNRLTGEPAQPTSPPPVQDQRAPGIDNEERNRMQGGQRHQRGHGRLGEGQPGGEGHQRGEDRCGGEGHRGMDAEGGEEAAIERREDQVRDHILEPEERREREQNLEDPAGHVIHIPPREEDEELHGRIELVQDADDDLMDMEEEDHALWEEMDMLEPGLDEAGPGVNLAGPGMAAGQPVAPQVYNPRIARGGAGGGARGGARGGVPMQYGRHNWGAGMALTEGNQPSARDRPSAQEAARDVWASRALDLVPAPPDSPEKARSLRSIETLYKLSLQRTLALVLSTPGASESIRFHVMPSPMYTQLLEELMARKLLLPKHLNMFIACKVTEFNFDNYGLMSNEMLLSVRSHTILRQLSVANCPLITDQGVHHLAGLTSLTHLNLRGCSKLTSGCIKTIKEFKSLRHLDLSETRVHTEGITELCVARMPLLTDLHLESLPITDSVILHLSRLPQLTTLNLQATKVADLYDIEILKVEKLNLCLTMVTLEAMKNVARMPKLTSLNLKSTPLLHSADDALRSLAHLSLTVLDLPGKESLTDDGIIPLCKMPLQELVLANFVNITDKSAGYIASMSKTLKVLDLSNTKMTDEGVSQLGTLTGLQSLFLDHLAVTDDGVKPLLHLVRLQDLSLSHTSITSKALAAGLTSRMPYLVRLNLSYTLITDEGLRYLTCPRLTHLNLDGSCATEDGLKVLSDVTPSLKSCSERNLRRIADAK